MVPVPLPAAPPSPAGGVVRTAAGALQLVLLVAVTGLVLAHLGVGLSVRTVLSDSMRPAFAAGDHLVVVDRDPGTLRVGDVPVLTFADGEHRVHRVVAVDHEGPAVRVLTRGDANPVDDAWTRVSTGRTVPVTLAVLPPTPAALRRAVDATGPGALLAVALLLSLGGLALTFRAMQRQYRVMRSCRCPECRARPVPCPLGHPTAAATVPPEPPSPSESESPSESLPPSPSAGSDHRTPQESR